VIFKHFFGPFLYSLTFASPLPSHSAQSPQTNDKRLSGSSLTGSLPLACLTISSSPDELQALNASLLPPLPSQSAQTSDKCSSGISFYSMLWIHSLSPHVRYPPALTCLTSYKCLSGLSLTGSPPLACLTISSSPDELQVLVWLFFQFRLYLHLSFHVIQPRRATSTRLDFFFHLDTSLLSPLPSQSAQTGDKCSSGIYFYLTLRIHSLSPPV
jgi:hypothetical protein